MFEVGFTEIILILGLALLVLGPEKLPGLAQKVGRWTGRARSMARQLRTQLEHEVTMEELAKSRPMPSPATSETGAPATSAAVASAATAAAATSSPNEETPPPTGPELDLDATVLSIEPTPEPGIEHAPPEAVPESPTTKTVQ